MKDLFLLYFLLLSSFSTFSQTDKEAIQQIFTDYSVHVVNKDNAKVVEYMHPGIFEMAPKEMLIETLDKTYSNPNVKIELRNMQLDSISEIIVEGNNKYSQIFHSFSMQMQMLPENKSPQALKEAREAAAFTFGIFKDSYGEENVKFDAETITFDIFIASRTLALNDQKTEGWKFMELKSNTIPMLKNIVSEKVLKRLE